MLKLTRNIGEKVIVRDDVYIEILGIRGSHVKIGIEAPPPRF
ncbi:carbon storage regulator [Methylophaga sp. OBS3]|nr:carbon storage regulator [Methylophaga sp. OBS3]MCX4190273.1 carbon storage regulator [Methylophaga sp. OBS3]